MGGETYRVETTGHRSTRPTFRWPCTPHHKLDVAVHYTQKNRFSAVVRFCEIRGLNPDTGFCQYAITLPHPKPHSQQDFTHDDTGVILH